MGCCSTLTFQCSQQNFPGHRLSPDKKVYLCGTQYEEPLVYIVDSKTSISLLSFLVIHCLVNEYIGYCRELTGKKISRHSQKFSKPSSQIPFEEKSTALQKTEEQKKSDFLLSSMHKATSILHVIELRTYHSSIHNEIEAGPLPVPIYLSNRSLLI